jgi:hypothetical protein
MLTKSQKIVTGLVLATLSVLSITAVYIPSQMAQKGDEIQKQLPHSGIQRGSMWKHLDAKIKEKNDTEKENSLNETRSSSSRK